MSFAMMTGGPMNCPSDRVKILFATANSALGSSFEKLSPALLHIFGQALRPNHVVIKYFAA